MPAVDVYLRQVPSDANPDDVRLYDPTVPDVSGTMQAGIVALELLAPWLPADDEPAPLLWGWSAFEDAAVPPGPSIVPLSSYAGAAVFRRDRRRARR